MQDWSNNYSGLKYYLQTVKEDVEAGSAAGFRFSRMYLVQEYKGILFYRKEGKCLYLPFIYCGQDICATRQGAPFIEQ